MKNLKSIFYFSFLLFSCSLSNNKDSCSFKVKGATSEIQALQFARAGLFDHVKGNPYCDKIIFLIPARDNYGNINYKEFGHFELTEQEYTEMRKYSDYWFYSKEHPIETQPKLIP